MERTGTTAKPHEGFKQRLLERAAEGPRKYAFLKKIAQSPHFIEVEAAIDNTHKGRGGVFIDQAWLITAIEHAHAHYSDKTAYLPLKVKTKTTRAALKKAKALLSDLEKIGTHPIYKKDVERIVQALQGEIDRITLAHVPYLSRSRPAYQWLTIEQIMFCFWLAVWLVKRYPKKRFSTLIASIVLCLFDDAELITGERVKNTLASAQHDISKKAANLKI